MCKQNHLSAAVKSEQLLAGKPVYFLLRDHNGSPVHIEYRPEDHWSCFAHLIAEDMLKSAVIEEKKFKNIECK